MAVDFKVDYKRGSEYLFLPEDVTVNPELNGRHDVPDIGWLIEDILAKGQLQPVLVRNDGGRPVLVAGFSRWRAISEINRRGLAPEKLKVRCVYFRGNEKEAFLANISENKFRNVTTPLDDAHNCDRLEKWGMSIAEIAKVYREKECWVRDRLALLSLCEEARDAVKSGKLKPTAAATISKLSSDHQRAAVKGDKKITVKAAAAAVNGGPVKRSLKDLKQVLRGVIEDKKVPIGKVSPDADDALYRFCLWLQEYMEGK